MNRSSFLIPVAFACMLAGVIPCSGEVPRPEHPRPDQFRENWMTLNGEWQFEITDLLADGRNEVVVQVKDDQWSGLQPRGKQANGESRNVFYTRTTGIWQSVWLEAVGSSFVENLALLVDQ